MPIRALTALAVLATLALAGCSAPEPLATNNPAPASIAGNWTLVRTVTASGPGTGYAVGDSENRYLVIAAGSCTAMTCTGSMLSSNNESVFSGGPSTTLGYHWDGAVFSYDPSRRPSTARRPTARCSSRPPTTCPTTSSSPRRTAPRPPSPAR